MGSSPAAALDHGGWSIGTDEGRRLRQHKGLRTVLGMPLNRMEFCARCSGSVRTAIRRGQCAGTGAGDLIDAQAARSPNRNRQDWTFSSRPEPLGTIGAVASLPREIEDAVIVNVDNLTSLDLKQLAHYHGSSGGGDDCHP